MAKKFHHRIPVVDLARGVALIAMAIFHFGWDLESFGLVRKAMTLEPEWKYFARAIASSFLFLVGASAWLAHHNGFSRKTFAKRIVLVGGAALLITITTLFATPEGFIFFGILHNITLSSLLILLLMRIPVIPIVVLAILVFSAPIWARTPLLDNPVWWWSGLSQIIPKANDYVPIFPWFGWVLLGLATAKTIEKHSLWEYFARVKCSNRLASLLCFFGRHGLLFYLLHQPIMICLIYSWIKITSGNFTSGI